MGEASTRTRTATNTAIVHPKFPLYICPSMQTIDSPLRPAEMPPLSTNQPENQQQKEMEMEMEKEKEEKEEEQQKEKEKEKEKKERSTKKDMANYMALW